jgi:hypothetical protein
MYTLYIGVCIYIQYVYNIRTNKRHHHQIGVCMYTLYIGVCVNIQYMQVCV